MSAAPCHRRTPDCAAHWSGAGLSAGADIAYDRPPVPGLEQHVRLLEGALEVTVGDRVHQLGAGDRLRTRGRGATRSRCAGPGAAPYVPAVVRP